MGTTKKFSVSVRPVKTTSVVPNLAGYIATENPKPMSRYRFQSIVLDYLEEILQKLNEGN